MRTGMLQWMILPLMGAWLVFNYFTGLARNPQWGGISAAVPVEILGIVDTTESFFDMPAYRWSGEGVVSIWFDDAWVSQYTVGYPMMEANGLTAAIAVPTNYVGYDAYASWTQIKRLQFAGWEIASHSRNHNCAPKTMSAESIRNELGGSLNDLRRQGLIVEQFVAPCGETTVMLKHLTKDYYLSYRSADAGINPLPLSNPYHILAHSVSVNTSVAEVRQWIDEAKTERGWLNLIFHQIDESGEEYSVTPVNFEAMIKEVKDSQLPVVLPSQMLRVIRAD